MLTHEQRQPLVPRIRTLQLIIVLLVGGVLSFAAVIPLIASPDTMPALPWMFQYVALALAVAAIPVAKFIGGVNLSSRRRQLVAASGDGSGSVAAAAGRGRQIDLSRSISPDRLFEGYFTQKIVMAALYEGAALMNLVVCLAGVELLNIAAVGVLVVAMLAQLPTLPRAEAWIEREYRQLQALQQ